MTCRIYEETGVVPTGCLFGKCSRQCHHDTPVGEPGPTCKRCGSNDVRWRQQGGRWVLFSLTPGVLHKCPPVSASEDFKRG